jgi:hypothetical protein
MSLEQIKEKIKPFLPILNWVLIIAIFLAFISLLIAIFQVRAINARKEGIEVIRGDFEANFATSATQTDGVIDKIVASRNGTRYYFPNCSGARAIKPENRVFFESIEEAERAGLTLAKNCKKP